MNTILTIALGWSALSCLCWALIHFFKLEEKVAQLKAQEMQENKHTHHGRS